MRYYVIFCSCIAIVIAFSWLVLNNSNYEATSITTNNHIVKLIKERKKEYKIDFDNKKIESINTDENELSKPIMWTLNSQSNLYSYAFVSVPYFINKLGTHNEILYYDLQNNYRKEDFNKICDNELVIKKENNNVLNLNIAKINFSKDIPLHINASDDIYISYYITDVQMFSDNFKTNITICKSVSNPICKIETTWVVDNAGGIIPKDCVFLQVY